MSISSELLTLQNTKTAIRAAINNKGGSVGASDTFASYATAIDNLPSGGDNSTLIDLIERDITSITIPSGTTKIGEKAFSNCSKLTSVTIPNGVTTIGDQAFTSCTSLTNINIPNSVTSIGSFVFQLCTSLTNINIPNSVTSIGSNAFANCSILATVTIGSGITQIPQKCFNLCSQLSNITIPSSVTIIGQEAFRQSGLNGQLNIPSSVTTVGPNSFTSCTGLTSIIIGNGITRLDSYAFSGCSNLSSVTILATTPPTIAANTFNNTNNCPIYVPAESLEAYKAASGWSTYASRIYPIQQVATVDGNPVYNYDIGNTDSTVISDTERSKIPTGDSIEFAEGVTQIGGQLGAYEEVVLPSTFTSFIDTQPINAATTTLACKATTPPSVERSNLGGSGLTAVYVPASAVDTYKENATWSSFASIIQAIPSE